MIVIPAVDIRKGKCVQLTQGKPGTEKYYGDPVEVAAKWEREGAHLLHVVDIDAALGEGSNLKIVRRIRDKVKIPIQFGGGIRDVGRARELLDSGIDRIILGTLAVKEPKVVKQLNKEYMTSRLMVAVDSMGGEVMVKGWTEGTGIKTAKLIKKLQEHVFGFLVTDVDKEGKLAGIDLKEFKDLVEGTNTKIFAAGGITTQKDVEDLRRAGVWGCVIGKALYEGKISLKSLEEI
jgi:phosphoribosylformimino-5-aminoimidazole carboxamide ribotide isomerase